jgi:hypothetical protein
MVLQIGGALVSSDLKLTTSWDGSNSVTYFGMVRRHCQILWFTFAAELLGFVTFPSSAFWFCDKNPNTPTPTPTPNPTPNSTPNPTPTPYPTPTPTPYPTPTPSPSSTPIPTPSIGTIETLVEF